MKHLQFDKSICNGCELANSEQMYIGNEAMNPPELYCTKDRNRSIPYPNGAGCDDKTVMVDRGKLGFLMGILDGQGKGREVNRIEEAIEKGTITLSDELPF